MKQPRFDKDYRRFADDLQTINAKINTYGLKMLSEDRMDVYKSAISRSIMNTDLMPQDFDRLVTLSLYDYEYRHSTGANSLENANLSKDFRDNDFFRVATLLVSDEVSNKSKDLILGLLETDTKYPYSFIVQNATVQGMFSGKIGVEENLSFERNLEKKLEVTQLINKTCDETFSNSSSKQLVRNLSSRLSFPPRTDKEEISKITKVLLNNFDKMGNFCRSENEGVSEIKESLSDCYNNFICKTNKFSNVENTRELFNDLSKITNVIKKFEVNEQYNMNLENTLEL